MARTSKVAVRYAQSLFDFSVELGILEAIEKDMETLGRVIAENRSLKLMLENPVVPKPKKISILNAIFQSQFHQSTTTFIKIITTAGREKHLEGIALYFKELYKTHKGIMTVTLMSAAPLNDEIKKHIVSQVSEATGSVVELEERILPALIGGFILEYDNKQIDASLLHHLEKLRKEFKVNRYIRAI